MTRDWKNESIDDILNYDASHTGKLHRFDRIMRQYEIEALKEVRAGLHDVKKSVLAASNQLAIEMGTLKESVNNSTVKQGKFQRVTVGLTVVLAVASVLYTWVTWQSVLAQRESNTIQRAEIEAQIKAIPSDAARPQKPPESP